MKIIKKILVVCLLFTSLFSLTGCATTVNLNDYVTIDISGYNTVGRASATFDEEKFIEDYGDKIKFDIAKLEKYLPEYAEAYNTYSVAKGYGTVEYDEDDIKDFVENIIECSNGAEALLDGFGLDYNLDKRTGLSNGDKVTLKWFDNSYNSDYEEYKDVYDTFSKEYCNFIEKIFNINLKYSNKSATVSGLEEVSLFDPFSALTVKFTGISPNGYVEYDVDSNVAEAGSVYYHLADDVNNGNLSVGDVITIKAEYYNSEESFASQYGKVLSSTEKQYTVDGLGQYVSTASQIDDTTLERMKSQCQDAYSAKTVSNFDENEAFTSLDYIGNYVLFKKTSSSYNVNKVYLVYKANISVKGTAFTYYTYYEFSDLVLNADGSITVDLMDYNRPSNYFDTEVSDGWWSSYRYYGFDSLDSLYTKAIQSEAEYYTIETNVTE